MGRSEYTSEAFRLDRAIWAMRQAAAKTGEPLSIAMYDEARRDRDPTSYAIKEEWGWNHTKRMAGLQVTTSSRTYPSPTRETAKEAITRAHSRKTEGTPLSQADYNALRDATDPSATYIRENWNWSNLLRELGLRTYNAAASEAYDNGKRTTPSYDPDAAVAAVTRVAEQMAPETLTSTRYTRYRHDDDPTLYRIIQEEEAGRR